MNHKTECECRRCSFPDAVVDTDAILRIAERKCMDAYAQSYIDSRFVEIVGRLTDLHCTAEAIAVAYE